MAFFGCTHQVTYEQIAANGTDTMQLLVGHLPYGRVVGGSSSFNGSMYFCCSIWVWLTSSSRGDRGPSKGDWGHLKGERMGSEESPYLWSYLQLGSEWDDDMCWVWWSDERACIYCQGSWFPVLCKGHSEDVCMLIWSVMNSVECGSAFSDCHDYLLMYAE